MPPEPRPQRNPLPASRVAPWLASIGLGIVLTPIVLFHFDGAQVAYAQATVTIRVTDSQGSPADATVTLTAEGGRGQFSCRTRSGQCTINSVPSGRYVVTAAPNGGGRAPVPRPTWLPGDTPAEVIVRLR